MQSLSGMWIAWAARRVLEQAQLFGPRSWLLEMLSRQRTSRCVEPQLFAGHFEAADYHPGVRSCPLHSDSPGGIVVLPAPHIADQFEDMAVAIGIIRDQPFPEQVPHLKRQPQQYVTGFFHACGFRRFKNTLDFH